MKEIAKEIRTVCDFCSQCEHYAGMATELDNDTRSEKFMKFLPDFIASQIKVVAMTEEVYEEKSRARNEDSLDFNKMAYDVEDMLSIVNERQKIGCPKIQKAGLDIDIYRDLIFPNDLDEAMLILDQLSHLSFPDCWFKNIDSLSPEQRAIMALAKMDVHLMTKGIDIEPILEDMDIYFYNREKHIFESGYSSALISYYKNKLKNNEILFIQDNNSPKPPSGPLSTPPAQELLQRLTEYNLCDENHMWKEYNPTLMAQAAYIIAELTKLPKKRKWACFEEYWEVTGLQKSFKKKTYRSDTKNGFKQEDFDELMISIFPEFQLTK